jgi:hypothetical protein
MPTVGEATLTNILKVIGGTRTFLFAVAFLSIGLESDFKSLKKQISGGKPVRLYITGQALNIILTLIFAWFLFGLL